MQLEYLHRETLNADSQDVWRNECASTPLRVFEFTLDSLEMSLREVMVVFE